MAPGVIFLYHLLFPSIVSLLVLYSVHHVLEDRGYSGFTFWKWAIGVFLARPVISLGRARYARIQDKRRAAALGAVLPPQIPGSSMNIISSIVKSFSTGYIGDVYVDWFKQYGYTIGMTIFGELRIVTVEPEHIKALLATQFNDFEKGPILYSQFKSLLGSGVFNSDGEMWKFHRNMTRPFFTKNRISDFDNFERHSESTIAAITARLHDGYPIDFQDAVARFTLDSATEFLLGKDVESLGAGLPYPANSPLSNDPSFLAHPSTIFAHAFLESQEISAYRTRAGMNWPLWEFWVDKAKKRREVVDEFVNPILEERRKGLASENGSEKLAEREDETFLDLLIRSTEDKQVIKDELINILVAGRDTTASLLTFAVYVLTQRPDLTERLRKEIQEKIGGARPTYKDITDMRFLRAFLNETLRLYPPVPFNSRTSKAPTLLPSKIGPPIYIPGRAKCLYSVFLMHRREDLWGPTALDFDPDRFLDERVHEYLTPNPFIFLPFNAGPRICLGQQFAYNEASYFLIKLLQTFNGFELAMDVQAAESKPPAEWVPMPGTTKGRDKIMFMTHLTMSAKGGMWVRMKDEHSS